MGRRSLHTPEELRRRILDAAKEIVAADGTNELSAREIARAIGYAPGTLYNLFRNLDEILLHVEAELLADLDLSLKTSLEGKRSIETIRKFAADYAAFAYKHARLWQLLQRHHPADELSGPDWYLEKVYAPTARLEAALVKLTNERDVEAATRSARVLWSAIHGIVQVATTSKFGTLPMETTIAMVEDLVQHYLTSQIGTHPTGVGSGRSGRGAPPRHAN